LSGIIYLHRITDVRMAGSSLRNLSMFKKLCGENFYSQVMLVTTMWDNLRSRDVGEQREKELLRKKEWWGLMAQRGSKTIRHNGSKGSALMIINHLMNIRDGAILDIQREIVDEKRDLADTSAGR